MNKSVNSSNNIMYNYLYNLYTVISLKSESKTAKVDWKPPICKLICSLQHWPGAVIN